MGPKKKQEEIIDISSLPQINLFTSSIFPQFNWNERKFKLLENLYRATFKNIRFICREQMIEFAKEKGIFIDETDYKKNPNAERKEMTAIEYAKTYISIIQDRCIPVMKEKKVLIEKIEELTKLKEDLIYKINNPEPQIDNKKLKPDGKNKKEEIQNPNDIIIPTINEYETDLVIIFLNYPSSKLEMETLISNEYYINSMFLINETDLYIEPVDDPKDKKKEKKEAKPAADIQVLQKYFINIKDKSYIDLYHELLEYKINSPPSNLMRNTFFDKIDFSYQPNEDPKLDNLMTFPTMFLKRLEKLNMYYLYYGKWKQGKSLLQEMSLIEFSNAVKKMIQFKSQQSQVKQKAQQNENNINKSNQNINNTNISIDNSNQRETNQNQMSNKLLSLEDYLTKDQLFLLEIISNKEKDILYNFDSFISNYNKADIKYKSLETLGYGIILFLISKEILKFYRDQQEMNNKIYSTKDQTTLDDLFFNLEKEIEYNFSNNLAGIQSNSYVGIKNANIEENIDKSIAKTINEMSSAFKLIIDVKDDILKKNLENQYENELIAEKEKSLLIFNQIPGINRYKMESPPLKEEHFRKALKSEIYPFLSMPIILYEKFKSIQTFEEIYNKYILSELNNTQQMESVNFGNRIFIEPMNRDILSQVLCKTKLYDSEELVMYSERDDCLFMIVYYKIPSGRVYHKMTKHRYLSLPEFQNWVNVVDPILIKDETAEQTNPTHLVQNNDAKMKSNRNVPKTNVKEQENIQQDVFYVNINKDLSDKKVLYIADDNKIGELKEKIKYMYPKDKSVIVNKEIIYGIYNTYQNYIIKDNLVFGVRKNLNSDNEIWINFENNLKLTISYKGKYDNRILPSSKKNESNQPFFNNMSNGAFSIFNFPNGLEIQILPSGEILQKVHLIEKENNQKDVDLKEETHRIITSKGNIFSYNKLGFVKIMYSNGNTCEINNSISVNTNNKGYRTARRLNDNYQYELERIDVTNQTDPESNTQTMIRSDKVMSIKYIDKSLLTIHSDGSKIYTFPSKDKYLIEHESYATTEVRYDLVKRNLKTEISEGSIDSLLGADDLMIRSYDGILNKVICPDRTEIYTYKEKKSTGMIDCFTYNNITIIKRHDGTVIKIQQDGEIVIITSDERRLLNTKSEKDFDERKDIDYLFELFGKEEDRKGGVYSGNVSTGRIWICDSEKNLFEIDSFGNAKEKLSVSMNLDISNKKIEEMEEYIPSEDLYTERKISESIIPLSKPVYSNIIFNQPNPTMGFKSKVSAVINPQASSNQARISRMNINHIQINNERADNKGSINIGNIKEEKPKISEYEKVELEYINPESVYLDIPKETINPRLFIINNDNTGIEYLNHEQVSHFIKSQLANTKTSVYKSFNLNDCYKSHTWIEKYLSIKEYIHDSHSINNIKIPKCLDKIVTTPNAIIFPKKEIYLYRNLIESREFESKDRESIESSIKLHEGWIESKMKDFGKKENLPSDEVLQQTREIQRRILKERQNKEYKLDYDELRTMNLNSEIEINNCGKSILYDIDEHIEDKIKRIIHEDSDLRRLPLDIKIILIDQLLVSLKDIKDKPKRNRGKKIKEAFDNLKMNKEIKFISSYFLSEEGEGYSRKYDSSLKPKSTKQNMITNEEKKEEMRINDEKEIVLQGNGSEEKEMKIVEEDEKEDFKKEENYFDESKKMEIGGYVFLNEEKNKLDLSPKYFIHAYKAMLKKKNLPSLLTQKERNRKINEEKMNEEEKKYYDIRNYKYSVYGNELRKNLPDLNYIKTTFPEAEFNEDYIYIEKMTDPRVKTSSVANRLYFNAPSVNEIRKNGQHNFLMQAIQKKKTYDEMIERLNLMVTAELCDPMNKNLKIDPIKLNFNYLIIGKMYYADIKIRNDDNLSTRIQVVKEKPYTKESERIKLEYFTGGKLCPGISKFIRVVIDATSVNIQSDQNKYDNLFGNIKVFDNIKILTKSFIYKIPVKAVLTTNEGYNSAKESYLNENKLDQFVSCAKEFNPNIHKQNLQLELKLPPIYEKVISNNYLDTNNGDSQYIPDDTD